MDKMNVYRVILPSKKVVHFREMKMKYEDLAMQAIGKKGQGNPLMQQKLMGDELLKILIVDCDGQKLTAQELERFDEKFDYTDINAMRKVVVKITGTDEGELEAPQIELVSSSGAQ